MRARSDPGARARSGIFLKWQAKLQASFDEMLIDIKISKKILLLA
ncbi:hypothetical protein DO73_3925 [Burkholderia pseudomallei]|nr:hypothetical protein DO73_3925 [Burkholderia pseudomallei]